LGVFGNVVSEFSKIDDLAHRRGSSWRDFDQVEPQRFSSAQGVIQFQDAKLFAGGPHNDPDFAGANPTVYTNLWLQIRSSSWPVKRECAAPPYFHLSQFPGLAFAHAGALWLRHGCDSPQRSACIIIASRMEVVGNNPALARSISSLCRRLTKMRLVRCVNSCVVKHRIDCSCQ